MTDNRTTELLRERLTEHGIEWRSGLEGVTFVGDWCFVEYDNGRLAATCEPVLTPDQAIAATLGEQRNTAEITELLDEFEHECFMLRVEASETCARDDVVRKSYERIRDEFTERIAATLGSEREKALEELVRSLYADYHAEWPDRAEEVYADRMEELGIEADK